MEVRPLAKGPNTQILETLSASVGPLATPLLGLPDPAARTQGATTLTQIATGLVHVSTRASTMYMDHETERFARENKRAKYDDFGILRPDVEPTEACPRYLIDGDSKWGQCTFETNGMRCGKKFEIPLHRQLYHNSNMRRLT